MDWLKESDEEHLLADDELDMVDEELNEGLYVNPANYSKHNDLIDVVDKAGNPQKMTKATYDKNKGSGEFTAKEPEKKEVEAGKKASVQDLKEGKAYVSKEDIFYGDVEDLSDDEEYIQSLKDKGLVNADNEVVIPAGTKVTFKGNAGGAYVFDVNGEELDMSMDDVDLYEAGETSGAPKMQEDDFDKISTAIDELKEEKYKGRTYPGYHSLFADGSMRKLLKEHPEILEYPEEDREAIRKKAYKTFAKGLRNSYELNNISRSIRKLLNLK